MAARGASSTGRCSLPGAQLFPTWAAGCWRETPIPPPPAQTGQPLAPAPTQPAAGGEPTPAPCRSPCPAGSPAGAARRRKPASGDTAAPALSGCVSDSDCMHTHTAHTCAEDPGKWLVSAQHPVLAARRPRTARNFASVFRSGEWPWCVWVHGVWPCKCPRGPGRQALTPHPGGAGCRWGRRAGMTWV